MQRLKTRAQFEAAMAGGTVSRTPHFVLHRAPLAAPSASEGPASPGRQGLLFAVRTEPWIGAVVPKRWAKRAVTRNGIKRQIYNVSAAYASRLPAAAHVVRLRMDFARADFASAWSEALGAAVRAELEKLFSASVKAAPSSVIPAPSSVIAAPSSVIPAKAGTHGTSSVIPAQAGIQKERPR